MKKTVVRYKIKADRLEENKALIKKVFDELNEKQPQGLKYVSYLLNDGVSFMHIIQISTSDESNPLMNIKAFGEFTKNIKERCEEPPMPVNMTEVASYGF